MPLVIELTTIFDETLIAYKDDACTLQAVQATTAARSFFAQRASYAFRRDGASFNPGLWWVICAR
nr:hypothetical protein [Erwinia sp. Ejp617]